MSKLNPMSEERKREIKRNIIKELKSLIGPTIILGIIAAFFVFVINYQAKEKEEEIISVRAYAGDNQPIVIENEYLKMVMDPTTTDFELTVKSSGKVWHSVPEGAENDLDKGKVKEEVNKLRSDFLLSYENDAGLKTTLDSYSFSALNGIYEIEAGEDYIRVDYSLGKRAKEFKIPPVMPEARFLELTSQMDVNDSANAKQFYKKVDINNLKKNDNKEELLENYPLLAETVMYVLRPGLKDSAKKSIQQCFEKVGYTDEEFAENKAMDMSEAVDDNPVFNASVIYKLDGDDLVVEVPFSSLESRSDYPIVEINILPYFGSGGVEDEGYMLIPEGGGSIINFNNGKVSLPTYVANMYGWDMGIKREELVHSTLASMNLYGISTGTDSFICILEDGASYAAIQSDISGKTTSYNYVNAAYTIKPCEKYDMGVQANRDMYVFLENLPQDESIIKRYSFIDSGNYVDMAKDYREYLLKEYSDVFTLNNDSSTPVAISVVGAVDKVKQIVGVPVSRPLAITTYEEMAELMKELTDKGMDNLSVKYTGWCNGGVKQHVLNDVDTIHALGSKKDLKNTSETAKNLGVDFYLDGITDYAYDSDILDGFFSYTDAAKFLSRTRAELYEFSAVTYAAREGLDSYFLLHGDLAIEMANNLVAASNDFSANVSFQDIGKDLSSDFYKKNYISRAKQMNSEVEVLKSVKSSGQKIMINEGNSYAAVYADFITNMDLRGSEYTIIDECVPFYQIALHGYVNYAGYPINTCGNDIEQVLYSAEYGAGLSFSLMKESPFTLQKTLYTEYYASDYDAWGEKMMTIYNRYNSELGHTFNQTISDHKNLTSDVSCTIYEDGTKVYVNYGFNDCAIDGVTVPSRDYLVVK